MITLIPVDKKSEVAIGVLYRLLEERTDTVNISHREMPTMQQHRRFVASHPFRAWYLIQFYQVSEQKTVVVGAIYITHANEIGIGILNEFQGRGMASAAIRAMMAKHKPLAAIPGVRSSHWLANINPDNEHSIKMFTRMGFELAQNTYALPV